MSLETERGTPDDQLSSREAYLVFLERGPDEALRLLSGKTDPDSTARHLSILLQAGRESEAAELVRGRDPAERWCNLAAYAFARCGDFDAAEHVLGRTKSMSERVYQNRSAVGFSQGCFEHIAHRAGRGGSVPYSRLDAEDLAVVRRVRAALDAAFSFGSIVTPLAELAASLALVANVCLDDCAAAAPVAAALGKRSPVPLVLADAVLSEAVPVPDGLVGRLRNEHPNSFEARLKASMIEAGLLRRPGPALISAMSLKDMPLTQAQKAELLRVLYKIAAQVNPGAVDLIDGLVPELLRQDDPEFKLFSADQYLRHGNLDAAAALIEGADGGDPSWVQAAARLKESRGDVDGALELLTRVPAASVPPGMLVQAAALAHQHGRLSVAIAFLERAVKASPKDRDSRQNLALVYGQMGDFAKAAEHYRALRDAHPDEPAYALRLAASLALGDVPRQSLEVYESVCASPSAPVVAYLGRSRVLWSLNRAGEAFAALDSVRDRFWSDQVFLLGLLSAAYASGRDDAAGPVLRRLLELQKGGGEQLLQAKSLDDVKAFLLEQRDLEETFARRLLVGQVPWLLADSQMHRVPYFGWSVRTQPLVWMAEDPLVWARGVVYATNHFTTSRRGEKSLLRPIACPGKDAAVVVDMTALMTLHALGLLGKLPARFKEVWVPATYFARAMDERANLVPHQSSRREASAHLDRALDDGRLGVDRSGPGGTAEPLVEEHALEEGGQAGRYRLIDLGLPLYQAGLLGESQYARLRSLAHRPAAAGQGGGLPPLEIGKEVTVQLSTLQAVAAAGLLSPVLAGFRVRVGQDEEREIRHTERSHRFQESVAARHSDMWTTVGDASKFKRVPVEAPADWRRDGAEEAARDGSMAASMVALHRGVPLLADDRACQVLVLAREGVGEAAAFGTGHLLEAMMEDGDLGIPEGSQAFLQLMRWRYRFVVPPVEVLVDLAHEFRENAPGRRLREVAAYAHDSMRDPGLLNGPERTDPPVPMGLQLFNAWCMLAGEFVIAVWSDARFGEEAATKFTRWAATELLPSPPRNHAFRWQRMCASMAVKSAMTGALVGSLPLEPSERTRRGCRALGQALGLSEEGYRKAVTEIIDGF